MRLIEDYPILGGQVSVYDDTRSKTAKFDIRLTVTGGTEYAAVKKLADKLTVMAASVAELAEGLHSEAMSHIENKTADREARRQSFLANRKSIQSQMLRTPLDNQLEDQHDK